MKDTSPDAQRRVGEVFASMSGPEKLLASMEMADIGKEIATSGIRSRAAEISTKELLDQWLRLVYGDDVANQVKDR